MTLLLLRLEIGNYALVQQLVARNLRYLVVVVSVSLAPPPIFLVCLPLEVVLAMCAATLMSRCASGPLVQLELMNDVHSIQRTKLFVEHSCGQALPSIASLA